MSEKTEKIVFSLGESGETGTLELPQLPLKKKAVYPLTYFENNQPPSSIPLPYTDTNLSQDELQVRIEAEWASATVPVDIACHFLILVAPKLEVTCPEDWISFQVPIATKGSKISPLSLLQPQKVATNEQTALPGQANASKTVGVLARVLAQYRILRSFEFGPQDYVAEMKKKLENVFSDPLFDHTLNFDPVQQGWLTSETYCKLIAAYDMFLHRFTDHPLSKLREGTFQTRWRDCAAKSYLPLLAETLSIDESKAMTMIVDPKAFEQAKLGVYKEKNEIDEPYSYTPYLRDIGLSSKSPYSASENINLYHYVNIIAGTFGNWKSLNAKLLYEGCEGQFRIYCIIAIHLYCLYFPDAEMNQTKKSIKRRELTQGSAEALDPIILCDRIRENNGEPAAWKVKLAKAIVGRWRRLRPNSIGLSIFYFWKTYVLVDSEQ